jgi:hypothetical protein
MATRYPVFRASIHFVVGHFGPAPAQGLELLLSDEGHEVTKPFASADLLRQIGQLLEKTGR